jgi:predicted thioredoxin/glutaredoxin
MGKHKIEIFSSGCPLCKKQIENVKKAVADQGCGCDITVEVCEGDTCCAPAKDYGVKAVPTTVIDGKIAFVGKVSVEEIKAVL